MRKRPAALSSRIDSSGTRRWRSQSSARSRRRGTSSRARATSSSALGSAAVGSAALTPSPELAERRVDARNHRPEGRDEERPPAPAGIERRAELREAALEAGGRILLDEARDEDALADARDLGGRLRPPARLWLRREDERHRERRLLERRRQERAGKPGAQPLERGAGAALRPDEHDAGVAAVERELGRHAVGVAQDGAEVVVAGRGEHIAVVEVAPPGREDAHLLGDPALLVVVAPLLDPDRGQEGAALRGLADRIPLRVAQRLLAPRREPAGDRDRPRRAGSGGDQMVAFVPAVPGRLVPLVRLDEAEDRVAELDA